MRLLVLSIAPFAVSFDSAAVNVALPSIRRSFDLASASAQWVLTIYAVVFGGLLLASGRAADVWGRRECLAAGAGLFAVANLAATCTQTPTQLLVARVAEAGGAALMAPAALSLIVTATSWPRGRGRAFRVYGGAFSAGFAAGMLVGGVVTEAVGWRGVFAANAVLTVSTPLLVARLVAAPPASWGRPVSLAVAAQATGAMVLLILALGTGGAAGWTSRWTEALVLGFVAIAVAFRLAEKRSPHPLIPAELWAHPEAVTSLAIVALTVGSISTSIFFLSTYTQDVRGYSAGQSGLVLSVLGGAAVAGGWAAPAIIGVAGLRGAVVTGLAMQGAGNMVLAALAMRGSAIALVAGTALCGAGHMMANVSASTVFLARLNARDHGVGAGVLNTAQQLGTGIVLASVVGLATRHPHAAQVGALGATFTALLGALVAYTSPSRGWRDAR